MLAERPTAAELVAAVAQFLEHEVRPALHGRLAFHAKVAANALHIVERELTGTAPDDELASLRSLLGDGDPLTLNTVLADKLRTGELSIEDAAVRDHLIRSALSRLTVDNPRYPSLDEARSRWSHGGVPR
jgi:Domain of unknown function (DUF6285)